MMTRIFQVDAFTSEPFRGNPAGVCVLTETKDDSWLQAVAREMNLSETAFLWKRKDGYDLRWLTPVCEVDLCGHATLASAHTLWEQGFQRPVERLTFHTRSGPLHAEKKGDWILLDFPSEPPTKIEAPSPLREALGTSFEYVGWNRMVYLVEVTSEKILRELRPDYTRLTSLPRLGVSVTARSDSRRYDFVSRCFYPKAGINEDPVTGSAHCCLGPYWQQRLGKSEFFAYQASERGGEIKVRVLGDRVHLGGQAVTVLTCELL